MKARLRQYAVAAATLALLAGCGTDTPSQEEAGDDGCADVALAAALPANRAIGARPLLWKQCSADKVSARYGKEDLDTGVGDDHCTITLVDTRVAPSAGASAMGLDKSLDQAGSLALGVTRMNVEIIVETEKKLRADPQLLAMQGGPPTLPVVGRLGTGDPYGVWVPTAQDDPAPQSLIAVIGDRYTLDIECTEPVRNHDHAKHMYAPYVKALNLGALP